MQGDDTDHITRAADDLARASHKLAEQLYAQKAGGPTADHGASQAGGHTSDKKDDDDVVDADYTEVK